MANASEAPISIVLTLREDTCSGYLMHRAVGFLGYCYDAASELLLTRAPHTYKLYFSSMHAVKFQHFICVIALFFRAGTSIKCF
jgi:hypothetical protein